MKKKSEMMKRKSSKRDVFCSQVIEWGIIGVLVFSPLPAASVYEWSVLVIELMVLVMLAAYVLIKNKPRNNELLFRSLEIPSYLFRGFFIFLGLQVIPLPKFLVKVLSPKTFSFYSQFAPDFSSTHFLTISAVPSQTIREGLEIGTYVLLGFLILRTVTRRHQIMRLFAVIVGVGVFEALYGFFELYSRNPRLLFYKKVHYLDCVTGTFVNRNHLSGYLEMAIPLALGLIIARVDFFEWSGMRIKEKLLRISEKGLAWNGLIFLGVVAMALGIVFSKSRSGVFILVFSFVLLSGLAGLYYRRGEEEKKGVKAFLKVVFLVIVVFSLFIGISATLERFSLDELLKEQRPEVWGKTIEMIGDFPVFGSGLGTFGAVYPVYEASSRFVFWEHAHNDYLEYTAELGLIGTVLLLGGILWLLMNAFRVWKERRHPQVKGLALGGIAALVGILIHSITDFNLHIPANMVLFSVILSLTVVTAFYKRSKG